jgi:hypothetical protein
MIVMPCNGINVHFPFMKFSIVLSLGNVVGVCLQIPTFSILSLGSFSLYAEVRC